MDILYITPYVPSLIRVRPYNLIKYLSRRGHRVTVLSLKSSPREEKDAVALRKHCARVETVALSRRESLSNCLKALPGLTPFQAAFCHSTAMARLITRLLSEAQYDLVHVEHLRGAHFGPVVRHLPKVYDSVDCISLLFERTARQAPGLLWRFVARLDLNRTRRYESWLLGQYEKVLVTSWQDKMALENLNGRESGDKIVVLPNGVDLDYFGAAHGWREPETLIFSGKMSYHANMAAVLYLVQEVMPFIWAARPRVRVQIVGKDPPPAVRALARDERVRVEGYVPHLGAYLAGATISICPIRYGVGIQNKVLEAMAVGTPVVATPLACSALEVQDGEHLLVADEPPALAQQVLRLLDDPFLWQKISKGGRKYVEEKHDWQVIAERLEGIYREVT